jgi:REP element-mobilizing transposase RayT
MATATKVRVRRCRPLRVESDEHAWFVTSRIIEERFLLHPILTCGAEPVGRRARRLSDRLQRHCDRRLAKVVARANQLRGPYQPQLTLEDAREVARGLVGSALARAQERYGAEVYGLVVMSNHVHLVCRTRGRNLSKFMGYFKARITDGVNLLTARSGPLWARRYDAEAIVDDEGMAERVGYTVANPQNANLVAGAEQWPGLLLTFAECEERELEFRYFDATAWHRKKRPSDLGPFFKTATLTLSPIPSCAGMSAELYRQSVQRWVDHALSKAATRRKERGMPQGQQPLGVDKVIHADFAQRPRNPARRRRPYAHGRPENVRAYLHATLATVADYDQRAERYRNGEHDVALPSGTYRPPLMRAA